MKRRRKMKILSILMSAAMVFGTMPASIAMGAETDDIVQNSENTDNVSADDMGMDFTLSAYEGPTEDATGDPVVEETVPESEYAEEEGAGSVEAVAEDVPAEAETDENDYGIQMLYTIWTDYMDADGELRYANATEVTNSDTTWTSDDENGGWYVVVSDLVNEDRITVSGNVNLILWDDTILTASEGITVPSGSSLTIYGQYWGRGELNAETSDNNNAAIGGTYGQNCGVVTINGCTVTASAGSNGAGIGGGCGIGGDTGGGGTITINGGTVTASAGSNAAGIGGGSKGNSGDITISSGIVNAQSGTFGAGIGAGYQGSGDRINISGGEVHAQSSSQGAGIGGGGEGRVGGSINISGGEVYAQSSRGAGIGGGYFGSGGSINISGGTVTAQSTFSGAGIGGGPEGSSGGSINISGGTVTAQSSFSGAGIGGGYGVGAGTGAGGNITISGGIVNAQSGTFGAGIGGGRDGNGGTINISGGTVTASAGGNGAGIGGGYERTSGNITISGGTVTASAGGNGAGIGNGASALPSSSFSTGSDGSAFIVASSITDTSNKSNWSGAIIIGSEGQVYGAPTLNTDAEILSGDTLLIPKDTGLTIGSDTTLTNNGTVYQDWGGAFTKGGTYTGNGEYFYEIKIDVNSYWISCPYQVEYREKTYLPSDKSVTLNRDKGPYIEDVLLLGQGGSTVALTTQGREAAIFTMPAEPVHLVQSIDIPEADQTVFTYNGNPQTYALKESEYYTIEGNVQTDAGTYTVTVSLVDPTIYAWKDGTTEDKTYPFVINPEDDNDLPDPSDRNNIKTGTTVTVTAADLVYNGTRQNPGIVVTATDGTVLEKGVDYILDGQTAKAAGTHKATLTGIGNYYGTTTVNYKIAKADQKLTAKVKKTGTKKYTVKASKLKNDSRTFKIKVTKKGKMKVRYSTNNSRIKVDKNGKVTLKKGLKAGTYKIKVTTGASRNYKASKTPKYITVKVK